VRSVDITLLELERAIKHEQVFGSLPRDLSDPVRSLLREERDERL